MLSTRVYRAFEALSVVHRAIGIELPRHNTFGLCPPCVNKLHHPLQKVLPCYSSTTRGNSTRDGECCDDLRVGLIDAKQLVVHY
jgi:hypothetical protein